MLFYIDHKSIIYDGNPANETWQSVKKDATEAEVIQFFKDKNLWNHPRLGWCLQTKPDNMGCYDMWRVGVYESSIVRPQARRSRGMEAEEINQKATLHLHQIIEELESQLRFAAGYISATEGFTDKHPEDVLQWIKDEWKKMKDKE